VCRRNIQAQHNAADHWQDPIQSLAQQTMPIQQHFFEMRPARITDFSGVWSSDLLSMPFEMARIYYSNAVRLGLIRDSLTGSARYARMLEHLEQWLLGPLARHK